MEIDLFDYQLPPELIAQEPPVQRDGGRLMRVDRSSGEVSHHQVTDLPDLLPEGCLLVVNDSRVIPARLRARRSTGGQVEVLLVEQLSSPDPGEERWTCMARASKRLRAGEELFLEGVSIRLLTAPEQGRCQVALTPPGRVAEVGSVPLPPYIDRLDVPEDADRYQTVYAEPEGSIAAPTAGLHFTEELLDRIQQRGLEVARVTLHVGPGTFTPVRCQQVEEHQMEQERYEVSARTARSIDAAKARGRPVIAVGTTVVRALESSAGRAGSDRTELFITPGYEFNVVDGLMTNFHLPRSTLLMLVSAFAGRERILAAYREAVSRRYRFYSYGDATLIV